MAEQNPRHFSLLRLCVLALWGGAGVLSWTVVASAQASPVVSPAAPAPLAAPATTAPTGRAPRPAIRRIYLLPVLAPELTPKVRIRLDQQLYASGQAIYGRDAISYLQPTSLAKAERVVSYVSYEDSQELASGTAPPCSTPLPACLRQLERRYRADAVLRAQVGRLGSRLVMDLTLIEPVSGRTLGRAARSGGTLEQMLTRVHEAVLQAVGSTGRRWWMSPALGDRPLRRVSVGRVIAHGSVGLDGASLTMAARGCLSGKGGVAGGADGGSDVPPVYRVTGAVGRLTATFVVSARAEPLAGGQPREVLETFDGSSSSLVPAVCHVLNRLVGRRSQGTGSLRLQLSPPGLRLQLDGRPLVGTGSVSVIDELRPGPHHVFAQAEGLDSQSVSAYVRAGRQTPVPVHLTPRSKPWYKRWWVWTVLGTVTAGMAAGVIVVAMR